MAIHKPLLGKPDKQDVSRELLKLQIELDTKKELLKKTFRNELVQARWSKKKNRSNYARIGIAYYGIQVINAAQDRLEHMVATNDIKMTVDDLSNALKLLNGFPKAIGRINVSKLVNESRKLDTSAGTAGGDLVTALKKMAGIKIREEGDSPIDTLISADEIERWVNDDDYASDCLENGCDNNIDGEGLLDGGKEIYEAETKSGASVFDTTIDELRKLTENF